MIAVDTNAYSDLDAGNASLEQLVRVEDIIALPVIVIGEIRFGFELGNRKAVNEGRLTEFLRNQRVKVLNIDEKTTTVYAQLHAELRSKGTPIPANDLWIAALCLQYGCPLATADKHFDNVPLLQTITVK